MRYEVYNQEGEKIEEIELPKEIFDLDFNNDLVWQVAISQMANRRKAIAHTKTRKEVAGSGRKIWPQKHMGRARHGDIRAPIFRHGGVTFGPRKEKKFKKIIPKKMKRKALLSVLSQKARERELILLNNLEIEKPKTKLMVEIIENLKKKVKGLEKGSILIVPPQREKKLFLAARNIKNVGILEVRNLNCLDVLSYKYLLLPKESIEKIKEIFVS